VEVPYYYSKLTGYDFFSDPWYQGNIMYTIFQQPPFSKSGGNGSSHQNVARPNSIRIGYLDALARLTGNTYAADFVRRTLKVEPDYMKKALLSKPGDLAWFRLQCDKPLPEGEGLTALPAGYVFPATGLVSFQTNWDRVGGNAMWSFRSSPYGSTSHALANQNAFNTFYGGKPLFYSSGHHIEFTDVHSMLCHRATRAHNTILVNGMGQRIGTEGYGWIPRYYASEKIGYVLGDASNAYGKVISPLWLTRGEQSEVHYTPENGWDENHVKTFRRHIVNLGKTGLIFSHQFIACYGAIQFNVKTCFSSPMIAERSQVCHSRSSKNIFISAIPYILSGRKDKSQILGIVDKSLFRCLRIHIIGPHQDAVITGVQLHTNRQTGTVKILFIYRLPCRHLSIQIGFYDETTQIVGFRRTGDGHRCSFCQT
jgi:hypothetical protein